MKKLLIFALMILPMTAFSAPSVRVLGSGANLPGAGSTTKTTSVKATATPKAASAAKATDTTLRAGTVRAKVKPATGTLPKAATSAKATTATAVGSRFPVITPAHSYNTVPKQQTTGGTTIITQEIGDDPRFDMIRKAENAADLRSQWVAEVGEDEVKKRERQGYVFMWIEE